MTSGCSAFANLQNYLDAGLFSMLPGPMAAYAAGPLGKLSVASCPKGLPAQWRYFAAAQRLLRVQVIGHNLFARRRV
jgi:hypothetical protein